MIVALLRCSDSLAYALAGPPQWGLERVHAFNEALARAAASDDWFIVVHGGGRLGGWSPRLWKVDENLKRRGAA